MRRDSAIKKLLKIFLFNFLYIFTIKIFLKNTLLCLDSPKKKKKKKRRQVSAFPAIFKADFGRFRPVSAAGRYGPILAESTRFGVNRSGFGTNRAESARNREKKKKKKKNTADADQRPGNRVVRRVPRHATLDAGAAPLVPRPCFLVCKAVQVSHMQCLQLFLKCLELAFSFSSLGSSTQPNSAVTLIFTLGNSRIHPLSLGV